MSRLSYYLLFVLVISIFSCKNKSKEEFTVAQFTDVVQAYGPSSLSKNGSIYIDIDKSKIMELSQEIAKKAFSISPSLSGNIKIQNDHVIVFEPTDNFHSNKEYRVSLNLKNIAQLSSPDHTVFSFPTRVIPQDLSFRFKDYFIENEEWNLHVLLKLNDGESLSNMNSAIAVHQGKEKLDFNLESLDEHQYLLKIAPIDISNPNHIEVTSDSKILQMDNDRSFTFEMVDPSIFSLINTNEDIANNAISFIFSQSLNPSQNLNGLVKHVASGTTPKYKVDGNKLIIYTDAKYSDNSFSISKSLKSASGNQLSEEIVHVSGDSDLAPLLKNVGIGHIIPGSDKIVFPFEAQGLKSVQLEIFQVYSKNLQQFYQQNELRNAYNLEYVGEVVYRTSLNLADLNSGYNPLELKRYYFNLNDFIKRDKNSIYEIRLGFIPQDAYLDCASSMQYESLDESSSIFNYNYGGIFGYYEGFSWKDRDNPCTKAFYNADNYIQKMVISSNLGILAKKSNNGNLNVFVNDIRTSEPISGANIEVFNKAQKSLSISKTDSEGALQIKNMNEAFIIHVNYNTDENWLRIDDGNSLTVSKFDVSGRTKKNGLDGFIYGERNIWRPGDTMFIDFILHDPETKLPAKHPVVLSLEDSKGTKVFSEVSTSPSGPIYSFIIPTSVDYVTGDYLITASLGGAIFTKIVKVENIKPNKFAIQSELSSMNLNDYKSQIMSSGKNIGFQVDWLYGAPAKNKKVEVELRMFSDRISFKEFSDYRFSDIRSDWYPEPPEIISSTKTNQEGKTDVLLKLDQSIRPPGALKLSFKTTAYEDSGDFSSDVIQTNFSPYESYLGIQFPKDLYGYQRAKKNKPTDIQFVSISEDGKPKGGRNIEVNIYRMENYWWWNSYNDQFDMTNTNVHISKDKFKISTDSKGKASVSTEFKTTGRYYVQACDSGSGHCTGDYIYVGYVWEDQEMSMAEYEEAAQLNFTVEKSAYKVGETVQLNVPSYFDGKALVSLENGDKVVESFWTKVQKGNNKISFTAQLEMFPTIYAHITLLQKHADKANDMPIRSYGVIPVAVQDESLQLKPEMKMKAELKPKETFEITVKEQNKKPMYYTIAVVDEGLLNISRFKSPDPFNHFYTKPSLGVNTFDVYNDVLSAYGNDISRLFSIGGDGEIIETNKDEKANRFKPVVHHIGPFFLGAGAQNNHKITLPNYIGSVRVMLVAAENGKYGSAQKQIPVKQDLMVLATMPRQLSPGDKLDLPLTLFGMKDGLGTVDYGVQTNMNLVQFEQSSASIYFDKADEKLERLSGTVRSTEGIEKLGFFAKNNQLSSTQEIEIAIKNPNPITRSIQKKMLKPGEKWEETLTPIGPHDASFSISASSLYPINIQEHIDRLARYPYGCLEQRTSAAMAYLYQKDLVETTASQDAYARDVVEDYLNILYKFKTNNGYSVWPGSSYADNWLSSYVGDFLLQAKEKAYNIPEDLMNNWVKDQKALASNWSVSKKDKNSQYYFSTMNQAYRLYTLAKANKPMLNEMNRLREDYSLDVNSAVMLAASYTLSGNKDVADQIIKESNPITNQNYYGQYGSDIRNLALQALMYHNAGATTKLSDAIIVLNEKLQNTKYLSTQTASFVLQALAKVTSNMSKSKDISLNISVDGNTTNLSSAMGVVNIEDKHERDRLISIVNTTDKALFVQLVRRGKEAISEEKVESSKLSVSTKFTDLEGKEIDVKNLPLGTDIRIITTVSRPKVSESIYSDLALRQVVPSGWEIINNRIFGISSTPTGIEYQDFKDNQVNSFFSLASKTSITIEIIAKASYPGSFYFPKLLAESMYHDDVFAEQSGFSCEVLR